MPALVSKDKTNRIQQPHLENLVARLNTALAANGILEFPASTSDASGIRAVIVERAPGNTADPRYWVSFRGTLPVALEERFNSTLKPFQENSQDWGSLSFCRFNCRTAAGEMFGVACSL